MKLLLFEGDCRRWAGRAAWCTSVAWTSCGKSADSREPPTGCIVRILRTRGHEADRRSASLISCWHRNPVVCQAVDLTRHPAGCGNRHCANRSPADAMPTAVAHDDDSFTEGLLPSCTASRPAFDQPTLFSIETSKPQTASGTVGRWLAVDQSVQLQYASSSARQSQMLVRRRTACSSCWRTKTRSTISRSRLRMLCYRVDGSSKTPQMLGDRRIMPPGVGLSSYSFVGRRAKARRYSGMPFGDDGNALDRLLLTGSETGA